jgi:hypothetical protein
VISENTVSGAGNYSGGGGVYVNGNNAISFSKTGGVIYGDTDGTPYPNNGNATDNTAKNGNTRGHAVYHHYYDGYYRDTTLNAGDNISADTLPDSGAGYGWTKR